MQADPSGEPPFAFSRQPGKDGGFLDAASGTTYQNDWMVHSNRTFKQLTNNEEIVFDWVSPNPAANHTSRHTAASCVYRYRHVGKSPSSFDAKYRLEIKVYDAKSPNGRSIVRKEEAMQLCQLNAHNGVAARDLGKWTLNILRNGQNEGTQEFTVNEPLKPTDTGWTRVSQGQLKSASDLVGYTRDEALVYRGDYTIPEPEDGRQEQDFRVTWHLKAPKSSYNRCKHNSFWSLESRYRWDGQRYSLKTTIFDQAYPNGRLLKSEEGDGRLGSFRLCYGQGLPKFGNYKFNEKIDKAAQTTQTLAIRQLDYSARSLTAGLFLDNGKVPFELSFNANPTDWAPSELAWQLDIVDSAGQVVRTYNNNISGNTDSERTWIQVWDGKDNAGNPVGFGRGISTRFTVAEAAASTAKRSASQPGRRVLRASFASSSGSADRSMTENVLSSMGTNLRSLAAATSDFFNPNADGSLGNPGDIWCVTSEDRTLGIVHAGKLVISVNRFENDPDQPVAGKPSQQVGRGSFFSGRQRDQVFSFSVPLTIPGQGRLYNIQVVAIDDGPTDSNLYPIKNDAAYLLNIRTQEFFFLFPAAIDEPNPDDIFGFYVPFALVPGGSLIPFSLIPANSKPDNTPKNALTASACGDGSGSAEPKPPGGSPPGYSGAGVDGGSFVGYNTGSQSPVLATYNKPSKYASPVGLSFSRSSGRFCNQTTDLSVSTRSGGLDVTRYYVGERQAEGAALGWNWSFQEHLQIVPDAEMVLHQSPTGHNQAFNGTQTFVAARGDTTDSLTAIDERHFQIAMKDKTKLIFEVASDVELKGTGYVANLHKVIDRNGNCDTYTWDAQGKHLLKMEGPDPSQFMTFKWSQDAGPDKITDHTGRSVQYRYQPLGSSGLSCKRHYKSRKNDHSSAYLLTKISYPGNKVTEFGYHRDLGKDLFTLFTTSLNGVVQEKLVDCDELPGVLAEATHRDEATLKFSRDNSSSPSTSKIELVGDRMPQNQSQTLVCEMNAMDQVVKATDSLGQTASAQFDNRLNMVSSTDSKGNTVTMTYDDRRNPTSSTDSLGRVTSMVWNSDDVLTQVTDANGQATTMEYDSHFNLISVTDPLGHQSTMTYNGVGLPTSSTDPLGHTSTYSYDSRGFLRTKTAPASGDGNGPATWTYTVDSLGRTTQVKDPLQRLSKIRFDERSRVVESTIPAVTAQVRQGALAEAKVTASYDNNDLLLSTTSVDGLTTRYEYDLAHKLVAVYQPGKAKPTRLKYNSLEQVVEMTNPNGSVTKYEFDRISRLKSMTYPGGNVERYTYDANSNLTCWDRGQYQVKYTFDELDRLRVLDSPSTSDHIALDYDALDRVQTMTDNSGVTTYDYTNNYLLKQISRPGGKTLTYGFDNGDRLTSCTDSDGGVTEYAYTDRDELASVSRDGQTIRYQHDLVGRVSGVTYPNGVNCRHQFSERNQLLKREYLNGSNPLLTLKYSFNQVGQRILDERISPQGTIQRNFGYDSQRHLTNSRRTQGRNVSYHNYCFDDNDNITQKDGVNFTVNSDDQLKRAGTIQLGYNAAGQAVTVNPKNIRYSYNDQIKSVTSPGTSVTMLYDGAGQRVAKTVNGQTARYLWNGGEILKEYAPDGTTKAEYLLGMGREAIKVGGAWKFYLKDIQGSTLGLVDGQGHVTDTYEYSDYGDTISRTGNSYNPFLYTGQELDAELGLYVERDGAAVRDDREGARLGAHRERPPHVPARGRGGQRGGRGHGDRLPGPAARRAGEADLRGPREPAGGGGRPRRHRRSALEPAAERLQVHRGRQAHHLARARRTQGRGHRRAGQRGGHRRARAQAHLRGLLPGGRSAHPQDRRLGPGAGHRQAHRRGARRKNYREERGRQGQYVHPAPAARRRGARMSENAKPIRILVVEDDLSILTGLSMNLRFEGYEVLQAQDGRTGLAKALDEAPDLVILDLMLPELNGYEVLRELRRRRADTAVVMLSAKGMETDKIAGLDLGADDYVVKPFGLQELLSRIKAVLRRRFRPGEVVAFGDVAVDLAAKTVTRAGKPVELTAQELKLLFHFINHPGRTFSRDELLSGAWGYDYEGTARTVDNFVSQLRQKLESDPDEPRYIVTARGLGYRFQASDE